jgi:ankyrin repeat protein
MIKKALFISLSAIFFFSPINAFGENSLHQAAYDGNIELVRKILRNKVDPDKRDSFGGTALHAAMFQKNVEIITLLINHGFDVNAKGLANGYTPLHDAVWANNLEAVRILLEHGARADIQAKDGLTPYEKAKKEGKKEIVSYMESKTSNPKNYDHHARTTYSENDVKAFVYNWFAGFDHQADIGVFKRHLKPEKVDMYFPDFPIKSISDFERWYNNVIDTIQWNATKYQIWRCPEMK